MRERERGERERVGALSPVNHKGLHQGERERESERERERERERDGIIAYTVTL